MEVRRKTKTSEEKEIIPECPFKPAHKRLWVTDLKYDDTAAVILIH